MKKTSLKDIAQAVGVSTALVSYVLNNQKKNRISQEIAQKIRQVAQAMNYQPNQIAQSLKTNRTRTLGLIVADIANPFSSSLARIIEDEADQHNYTVIFGSSDENAQKCQKLITTFLNRQVDGLLIAPPEGSEAQIAELQQRGTPFVLIDRCFPHLKTNYVTLDNYQAIYSAVQHLIDQGYQRIGMVTFKTALFHINERARGYQNALSDYRLSFRKSWLKAVSVDNPGAEAGRAVQELTTGRNPVEALVFASNTLTLAGLKRLNVANVRVPDDVAVVGFDETEAYDLFYAPPTYIRQPLPEIGQLATRMLLEALAANNRTTQANVAATLVVRASTRPAAPVAYDAVSKRP